MTIRFAPERDDTLLMSEATLTKGLVGRLAGALFLASGAITVVTAPLPAVSGFDRIALVCVGLASIVAGIVTLRAPWESWPREASLVLVPVAFSLIGAGNSLPGSVPYADAIYFVVVFVWIGIAHRPRASLVLAPLAVPAYVIPIAFRGGDVMTNIASVAVVIPVCVLVGESLAWVTEKLRTAEAELRERERSYARGYELERAAAERLRALDNLKNGLVAAVSHELRTPLTSVLGLALTFERQGSMLTPERMQELSGEMASSARRLDRLLTDLLDVGRLARGVLEPRRSPTEMGALVHAVVERFDTAEHPIALSTEPVTCAVDVAQVERMIENLLSNAVRHTPQRTPIEVRCARAPGGVLIVVDDAGPGVPANRRRRVFEPFEQGETAPAHSPGIGVGLTLVDRFASLHGGRAWVQDRDGGGSSFRIFLPHAARAARADGRSPLLEAAPVVEPPIADVG